MSGLRIGTSWAALTFLTDTTCVTISSEVELMREGRSLAGSWRGVGVGHDLDDVPGLHGHEAVHLQDGQERLVEGVGATSAWRRAS